MAPWVALLALLAVAGCDPLGNMDFQGTYALVTVNGKKLPVAVAETAGAPPIKSGSITLEYGGTFVSVLNSAGPLATSQESSGTYKVIPSDKIPGRFEQAPQMRIDLTWNGGGVTPAWLDVRTLTVERDGVKYAFRYAKAARN